MSGGQLSFKFAKSLPKRQLQPSNSDIGFGADTTKEEEDNETLSHIEDGKIGNAKKNKDEPLVIPMITKNRWNALDKLKTAKAEAVTEPMEVKQEPIDESVDDSKPGTSGEPPEEETLEQKARRALLEEANAFGKEDETADTKRSIPILFTNQVPQGFETDEKLDVSLRPSESEEADYDSVPIEEYGMAMLRGMGWKEGDPIGLTNKQTIKAKIPELRPKGLGLGADKGLVQQLKEMQRGGHRKKENQAENAKKMRVGAFAKITTGSHRGYYGKITSFDEDNARVMLKLALGGSIATVSMFGVEIVLKEEYDKESKCINKEKYDKYKKAQEAAGFGDHVMEEDPLEMDSSWTANGKPSKKHKRKKSRSPDKNGYKQSRTETPWLRPDLTVRIIDKSFKGGKYFNEKVKILDVASAAECSCQTNDGILLERLSESMLETVIPKKAPFLVMILRGKRKGEVGKVVEKDKKRQTASIQLLRRQEKLVKERFDDISEFCGDSSAYED